MKRVTGIGGIFFKAQDPEKLREWYRRHLGFELEPWGGAVFKWNEPHTPDGATVWSLMPDSNDTFAPSSARFMVNYRVDELDALLKVLREEGCAVDERTETSPELGKFGWVMDPEGNRVELWEPPKPSA
jgi:predicted enzyme related to lactoylglutathione lyase